MYKFDKASRYELAYLIEKYLQGNIINFQFDDALSKLDEIESLDVAPWNIEKLRNIYGHALLFFRKLLKVTTKEGKVYFLRAWNAKHLKEHLKGFLHKVH